MKGSGGCRSCAEITLDCVSTCHNRHQRDQRDPHETMERWLWFRRWRFRLQLQGRTVRGLMLLPGCVEIGHSLILIETKKARVCPHEAFVENSARQLLKIFLFQRPERACTDLGRFRDFLKRNA